MTFNKASGGSLLERLRLYRYWATREFDLVIDGESTRISCTAGSNESVSEAEERCAEKAVRVQQIVDHQIKRESSYERPIREEILEEIDDDNVITRNYYGAQILNTSALSIFDIDTYQKTFWEKLTFKKIDNKTAIIGLLRQLYEQRVLPGTTWRIYETTKGIRLIVTGQYIDPESPVFSQFCRQINADNLYATLCRHQKCYRARLTPKPFRMKIKGIKYRCPIPKGEESAYREWVATYERESCNYSVCRLVETLGNLTSDNQIVELHDRFCCRDESLTLA
ncbi:MAG: hypothetical protein PHD82_05715 [Candidatus Riflebacteria bacterium]|jgi:hypothetical protein|nr:hypothetical protein [Candidatus Riflebacteria bacterium]